MPKPLKIILPLLALPVIVAAAIACLQNSKPAEPPHCDFYFWKTTLEFSQDDKRLADSLGMRKFYLRHFDVDWSPTLNMPVPIGELVLDWEATGFRIENYQMVPVVFIANRVFEHDFNEDTLAAKIAGKINGMDEVLKGQLLSVWSYELHDELVEISNWDSLYNIQQRVQDRFANRIVEVQIDCDWTPSTRERYFRFLEKMKQAFPDKKISVTVRLHQFRDPEKAGIPPADRGMLMCYNVAPPKDVAVSDAIFDPALVESYLSKGSYPLPLDAALPLFSWGALFHENQFKGLAGGLSESEVKGNALFEPAGAGRYRFLQDTVFADVYLRQGDLVRLDEPSVEDLKKIARRLGQIKGVESIAFFDWNPGRIQQYRAAEICESFSEGK